MTAASPQDVPLLSVQGLTVDLPVRDGRVRALDGVTFDIGRGEVLGVVGESGAGKSLTGAAIIGLLEPPLQMTGGRILLEGRRIDNLPRSELQRIRGREIAAIFQDPLTSLNPLFTIGQQLIETLQVLLRLDGHAARNRAIELLGEVGIPGAKQRLDSYPHQFSGGMRQRVAIALALAGNPRLIIADEPTTALDVSVQAQIIALLKRLCRDHGTSVMLVTHDMGVIAEVADRVAVMYAGRLAELAPVRAAIQRPLHPYTAGLMRSIPVVGARAARLAQVDGAMPRLGAIPEGCAFNPRCPAVMARCRVERPPAIPVDTHLVNCWLHDTSR
jgi:peptide/nickel transport system ATP-binding protein